MRKTDLFKTIRKRIVTHEAAFELLHDFDHLAAVYAALRDPQDGTWSDEEKSALEQLLMFNVRQPLAMLIACWWKFYEYERKEFTGIMKAVAAISFRYNVICDLQTHEQERLYNEIAWKVSMGSIGHPSDVMAALRELYPDDQQFMIAFADKELRTTNSQNKKVMRYSLFEIERERSEQNFDFESGAYSLEHVLPESPSEAWLFLDETKQERMVYRIGNMKPLETTRNKELGKGDYSTKRAAYEQSAFGITREIAGQDGWDEQKVEARQKQMAEAAARIWRVDFVE